MKDFEINEDLLDTDNTEIIDEKMTEATQKLAAQRERLLAYALHKGYDGVDIKMKNSVATNPNDFRMGFEYETWEGEPEPVDRFGQNVRRYDFRNLSEDEKQVLLARVGLADW